MARFLFASLPLAGHLDWGGMMATAAQLAKHGHAVAWTTEPTVAGAAAKAGVDLRPIPFSGWFAPPPLSGRLAPQERATLRRQRALDSWLHPPSVLRATAHYRQAIESWQPDVVVVEPYCAAAALAAEQAGVRLAVCGRPALEETSDQKAGGASQRIEQLCSLAGLPGRYWNPSQGQIHSPTLHIDYFFPAWYADLGSVGAQTHFVGGQARDCADPRGDTQPTVLITLGSLFRQDPAFFRIAVDAVLAEGGLPLVVTGDPNQQAPRDPNAGAFPHGTEVHHWVDFDHTFPQVSAIIHHGGVGTTHAALRHGVPQVAVPHAGDQLAQAGRITQAGVGFGVRPREFSVASARWLTRQLLHSSGLRAQAMEVRDQLHRLGGVPRAASLLAGIAR